MAQLDMDHNSSCILSDPHGGWGCGWYWTASVRDTPENRAMLLQHGLITEEKEENG